MSDLNKLLVHVPSSLCDDFRAKYIVDGANRDKSYDSKIVFLEDTKEIFTKGKIYGNNDLVGTLPEGATSTNIVDYINEKINNANHIHSVSGESGPAALITASEKNNKAVTVSSTKNLTDAVKNANSALQTITVLGKELYNVSGTEITVEEAKSYLGLGTDYKDMTYIGTYVHSTAGNYANTAYNNAVSYVRTLLPEVTAKDGSIIKVESSTDAYGKKTYKISTSAEVFHYKGNKTTITQLPSTGNTKGDVWSVGPANSKGSTLYAWDGDEWINLGSASGISGVNTTASYGIGLTNSYGVVGLKVTKGVLVSGNSSVVTGGQVYSAIEDAKNCSYTYTTNYINKLSYSYTSDSSYGSYVSVTVETKKGNVSYVGVEPTLELKELLNKAGSAVQTVTILDKTLYNGGSITPDEAEKKLNKYFDTKGTAQSLINDLRGTYTSKNYSYFDVEVTSYQGEVSYVGVYEKDNILSNAINNANSAIQHVGTSGSPYLTYDLKDNGRTVTLKFDVNEVFSYIIKNLTFDSLSTTFKNQMLSYVVSNWVGYTGEVGILRD